MQSEHANSRLYESIINDGVHVISDDFPQQMELRRQIEECMLTGIAVIDSQETADKVRTSGLENMHQHFAPEFLPFLTKYLSIHAKYAAFTATSIIGKSVTEIDTPFYIDDTIVYRIHYPHLAAIKSKLRRNAYFKLNLSNFAGAREELEKAYAETIDMPPPTDSRTAYHKNLPLAAWVLGAHKDTWLGHTFDAMNVWWSICGATEKNGLILYPSLFGIDLPHEVDPEFVLPGVPLPEPVKVGLKDGAVVVFNSDVMHATQLNIDTVTRIVLTGRINPKKPSFYENTKAAEYPDWHMSTDIDAGLFDRILKFPRNENFGVSKPPVPNSYAQATRHVSVSQPLNGAQSISICRDDFLPVGEKMLVTFTNAQIVVARSDEGLHAVSAKCPHIGISLADGFHNASSIFCPGHGVEFNLKTGQSECSALKLRCYTASIEDGHISITSPA